jgi:catechol 2,3-dioxygenase-like lactoylglutathione lyase family enzyme
MPAVALIGCLALQLLLRAQSPKPQLKLQTINHLALSVSNTERSLQFYQSVFGLRNVAQPGSTPRLRIGTGPQSISLVSGRPGLSYVTLGVAGFSPDAVIKTLLAYGVKRVAVAGHDPLTAWVTKRGESSEVFVNDPSGLTVQIQDVSYCGGTGLLGERCQAVPIAIQPSKAPARLSTINHVVLVLPDADRSRKFFQEIFGMREGKFVGPGPQWLGFQQSMDGGVGVDHFCFGLENFHPEGAIRRFVEFGLTLQEGDPRKEGARTEWGLAGPNRTRGFKRPPSAPGREMPIEVFVSAPDNFEVQVNDVNFCGGDGWLGDKCQ